MHGYHILATRVKGKSKSRHGYTRLGVSKEDWTSYEERLCYYFVANDVTDGAKKRLILLAACGVPAYKLIRSLVQAEKLDSTPYEELVKIVKNHYDPKSSVMQRYKFNTRTRTAGKLIAVYVAVLRDLAQHCEFKETLSDSYETGLSAE